MRLALGMGNDKEIQPIMKKTFDVIHTEVLPVLILIEGMLRLWIDYLRW